MPWSINYDIRKHVSSAYIFKVVTRSLKSPTDISNILMELSDIEHEFILLSRHLLCRIAQLDYLDYERAIFDAMMTSHGALTRICTPDTCLMTNPTASKQLSRNLCNDPDS